MTEFTDMPHIYDQQIDFWGRVIIDLGTIIVPNTVRQLKFLKTMVRQVIWSMSLSGIHTCMQFQFIIFEDLNFCSWNENLPEIRSKINSNIKKKVFGD